MALYETLKTNLMLEAEQVKPEAVAPEMSAKLIHLPQPTPRTPVRAPFRVIWRELRIRVLPWVAFLLALVGAALMWKQWVLPQAATANTPMFAEEPAVLPLKTTETVADRR